MSMIVAPHEAKKVFMSKSGSLKYEGRSRFC